MEFTNVMRIFKLIVIFAIFAVVFNIIAFTSNGWSVSKYGNITYRGGLWYFTECFEKGECKTISRRDGFSDSTTPYGRIIYSTIVRWQVVMTLSLVCSILCVVISGIALCRLHDYRKIGLIIIMNSVVSGFLSLYELGDFIRGIHLTIQQAAEEGSHNVFFPWSLVTVFLAICSMLMVSCLVCIIEWKLYQQVAWNCTMEGISVNDEKESGNIQYQISRKLSVLGICITFWSIVFQMISHAGNGWRIVKGYTLSTFHHGLWYFTECKENGDCKTISMKSHMEGFLDRGDAYSRQVGSQVVLTLSLILSIICLILLILETRKEQSNNLMRLSIIVCSLLSGTFWLYDVGHYIRVFAIDMDSTFTAYFPWSVLFALLGTILILMLSFIRCIKEFNIKDLDYLDKTNHQGIKKPTDMQNTDL